MKKIVLSILFGCISLSGTLSSMQSKQNQIKNNPEKSTLTTWDKVKIGSALVACGFCSWAALLSKDTERIIDIINNKTSMDQMPKENLSFKHGPSKLGIIPIYLLDNLLEYCNLPVTSWETFFAIHRTYLTLLALASGYYAGRKIIQARRKKQIIPLKNNAQA